MSAPRAAILGCLGPELLPQEAAFFRDVDPWGFILFSRNIVDPAQLLRLTSALREAVGRDAPVLIDQEGGRVQRMRPPHWRGWDPARDFCARFAVEADALEALRLRARLIAEELRAVGIDTNCAPVLDVATEATHPVILNRTLGSDPLRVALRGREVAAGLLSGGVLPVMKHMPGQGRAALDSHEALPVVGAQREVLRATDFLPFAHLRDLPIGMTAHVVCPAWDAERPATLSPAVIAAIREEIGFDGLLLTDDMSMGALGGSYAARAEAALAAGCDILLHCNGKREEMEPLLSATPRLAGRAAERAARALTFRRAPEPFAAAAALERLAQLSGEAVHA